MEPIRSIVIAGRDVIAPMVAAAIANSLRGQDVRVTLLDRRTQDAGAESLLPQSIAFHSYLGIGQIPLMQQSHATFKLATEFTDWVAPDESFLHPYGSHGATMRLVSFHHYANKQRLAGARHDFNEYSLAAAAAGSGRFDLPTADQSSVNSTYAYALHVDANLYAEFFRQYASRAGVVSIDGEVADTIVRPDDGFIEAVTLDDGSRVAADFFVDCSGDIATLIHGVYGSEYEDWSRYLPCDRSITLPVTETVDFSPLTRIVAKDTGWLRRIQVRNRSDFEFFYNSGFLTDDDAHKSLLRDLGRSASGDAYLRKFANGRRRSFWQKNCVAMGRAASYIEPLEISNVYLAQSAVLRLMALLPDRNCDPLIAAEYDRILGMEYDNVLDFLCLFYVCTQRDDSGFWKHARSLDTPESLSTRLRLFGSHGRFDLHDEEVFPKDYWVSALLGLGRWPGSYHPLADVPGDTYLDEQLGKMRDVVHEAAQQMPGHRDFLVKYLSD